MYYVQKLQKNKFYIFLTVHQQHNLENNVILMSLHVGRKGLGEYYTVCNLLPVCRNRLFLWDPNTESRSFKLVSLHYCM